jgi:hypothetical protein
MCGAQIFVANQFIAGIAIMALGALAQNTNVTVVPVGMNYFHAHKFRSRAVVEFGDPVPISPELLRNFSLCSYNDSTRLRDSYGTNFPAHLLSLYILLTSIARPCRQAVILCREGQDPACLRH